MSNFTRANPTGWVGVDPITPAQINHIDEQLVKAPNLTDGSSHAPAADVVMTGAAGLAMLGDFTPGALQAQNWPWSDDQSGTFATTTALGYSPTMVKPNTGIYKEAYFIGDSAGLIGWTPTVEGDWNTAASGLSTVADFCWCPGMSTDGTLIAVGGTKAARAYPAAAASISFLSSTTTFAENASHVVYTGSPYKDVVAITVAGAAGPHLYLSSTGSSWSAPTVPGGVTGETCLGMASNDAGTILAVFTNSKIIRSTDGGQTWSSLSALPDVPVSLRALAYSAKLDLWMFISQTGCYTSSDDGTSWSDTGATFAGNESPWCLAVVGRLWVAMSGGTSTLIYSIDEGATWWRADVGDAASYTLGPVIPASGRLVATTYDAKLFYSLRAGRETLQPAST